MNDNHRVTNNGADKNGANGIYAAGAVGNTFANPQHEPERAVRRPRRQPAGQHLDGEPMHHRLAARNDLRQLAGVRLRRISKRAAR
jgi:hypothetical protein